MRSNTFKAGAVIIGSLYWDLDKHDRKGWQKKWFGSSPPSTFFPISLPLRYGRYSSGDDRKCYTMILSTEYAICNKNGIGLFCPFNKPSLSIDELITATKHMSRVEGDSQARFILGDEGWAIMLCWVNPEIPKLKKDLLKNHWTKEYKKYDWKRLCDHFKMESESDCIFDEYGQLVLDWPKELRDYDIAILTQTQPRLSETERNRYPKPKEIAEKFCGNTHYFEKNRKVGITTVEDEEIEALLKSTCI